MFDIPLLNNLFISFHKLFISLIELKTFLNNLFIYYLNVFTSLIELKSFLYLITYLFIFLPYLFLYLN